MAGGEAAGGEAVCSGGLGVGGLAVFAGGGVAGAGLGGGAAGAPAAAPPVPALSSLERWLNILSSKDDLGCHTFFPGAAAVVWSPEASCPCAPPYPRWKPLLALAFSSSALFTSSCTALRSTIFPVPLLPHRCCFSETSLMASGSVSHSSSDI